MRKREAVRHRRPGGVVVPTALATTTLLAVILGAMRLVPGGPLASTAADQPVWRDPSTGAGHTRTEATDALPPSSARVLEAVPATVRSAAVRVDAKGWWSWALLDHRTGTLSGSANVGEVSTTASLIEAWIGADFLRRAAEAGHTPTDEHLRRLRAMIRDSDDASAETLWAAVGRSASIDRMVRICQLTDGRPDERTWSGTRISARDVARLGVCLADGRAAGGRWTPWLLAEMRAVRGVGDFGVRRAFPPALWPGIAIKNGWAARAATGEWHVSCLAIGDGWSIGVMTRYPAVHGHAHGATICRKVGEALRS